MSTLQILAVSWQEPPPTITTHPLHHTPSHTQHTHHPPRTQHTQHHTQHTPTPTPTPTPLPIKSLQIFTCLFAIVQRRKRSCMLRFYEILNLAKKTNNLKQGILSVYCVLCVWCVMCCVCVCERERDRESMGMR